MATSRHNSSTSLAPPEAQQAVLDESLQVVGVRAFEMRKHIEHRKTLDALKSCSLMLYELRTAQLSPKSYYELYMAIFDHLTWFSAVLRNKELLPSPNAANDAPPVSPSADKTEASLSTSLSYLYEVVQYAGNLLPRLYLMLTIGKVWLAEPDAPKRELVRDMLEMCKGIQHPVRGLFLRHYLAGIVKEHLPTGETEGPRGNLSDTIAFLITNFTEMNRLWVRLQYVGPAKDAAKRRAERREMRTLIGMNLVQLSQVEGMTLSLYKGGLLSRILDQVIACRDDVAQDYLLDSIIQVFPDHFHLATSTSLMEAIGETVATVDHYRLLVSLIERIHTAFTTKNKDHATFFATFLQDMANTLKKKGRHGKLSDSLGLFFMLNTIRVQHFPEETTLFSAVLSAVGDLLATNREEDPQRHFFTVLEPNAFNTLLALLLSPLLPQSAVKGKPTVSAASAATVESAAASREALGRLATSHASAYASLLPFLPSRLRCQWILRLLQMSCAGRWTFSTSTTVDWLLSLLSALYSDNVLPGDKPYVRHPNDLHLSAKLVWCLHHEDATYLLSLMQNVSEFVLTHPHAVHMGTTLIHRYLLIARRLSPDDRQDALLKRCFASVQSLLKARPDTVTFAHQSIRLYLQSADMANQCQLADLTYELFEEAFDLFDHHIHTAQEQMTTLALFRHSLYRIEYMNSEPYANLVLKCTTIASRLLKKHDQASTLAKCAILHWKEKEHAEPKRKSAVADVTPNEGKESKSKNTALLFGEAAEEGNTAAASSAPIERDGEKVLSLLQKCLKLSNTISSPHLSTALFVDTFDLSLWFLFHGCSTIATEFVNELANFVRSAASSLPQAEQQDDTSLSSKMANLSIELDGMHIDADQTRAHIARSMQFLVQKRAENVTVWNDLEI